MPCAAAAVAAIGYSCCLGSVERGWGVRGRLEISALLTIPAELLGVEGFATKRFQNKFGSAIPGLHHRVLCRF